MTASSEAITPRRRWLRIALLVSVALNLLLVGAAAGAFVRHRIAAASGLGGYGSNLLGYAQSLPPARRHEIWRLTKEERRGMHPMRAEVSAARQEWRDALTAESFDRTRFERAQARLLDAENKVRAEAQRLFLAIAGELTREERAGFVQWQVHERRHRRGGWRADRAPADDDPAKEPDQRQSR